MKKLFWIVSAVGLISLMIGAAGMDSASLTVPVAMVIVGGVLLLIGGKGLEHYEGFNS